MSTASPPVPPAGPRKILAITLGLTALLTVLLIAFALPASNSGANNVPIGVVGPTAISEKLAAGDEFDVTIYTDAEAAREAILDRDVYGAVVVGQDGSVNALVATAASPAASTLVEQLADGVAQQTSDGAVASATVTDVRAFPEDDPSGAGLAAGALPMALGGWIGAMVIMILIKSPARQAVAASTFAVCGGLGLTAVLQFVIGTVDGNYLLTALAAMLGISATAFLALGLRSAFGGPGLAVAAVLLIFLGNPLSGLSSAPELLPAPWGALGQLLPPGATGAMIRSVALFDGAHVWHSLFALAFWLVLGVTLFTYATFRDQARARRAATASPDPAQAALGLDHAKDAAVS